MVKILIANKNIEQDLTLCQYLANLNGVKVVTTTNGLSTLEEYLKLRPDIFILHTNLKDINYVDIINKLSSDRIEKNNCNTILVSDSDTSNSSVCITDVSKLYKIFMRKPDLQELLKIIMEMSDNALDKKIDLLFLKTKISLGSNPSDKVRDALTKCYYCSDLLSNINDVFDIVAKDYHTTRDGIRSSFRTALSRLNLYKDNGNQNFEIYKLFEKGEDVTPKHFLDVGTYYLRNKK